jgi:AcrR family transcriptional regulator
MGHKHSKEEMLTEALAAALDGGLSQLTFGSLARRLGISDRMVVYYFPSKDDLVRDVLLSMGAQLQQTLAEAISEPAADPVALVAAAWPVVSRPAADPIFALFFEAMGLAASGRDPYHSLVPELLDVWIEWVSTFFVGTSARRRAQAEAALALLDGLLLLRQLAGPSSATRAAKTLGIA